MKTTRIAQLLSVALVAIVCSGWVIKETKLDENMSFWVNDGGVVTKSLEINGATGAVTIGPSAFTGTHIFNGNILEVQAGTGGDSLLRLDGVTGEDAVIQFQENGTTEWTVQHDSSDASKFELLNNANAETFTITQAGSATLTGNLAAASLTTTTTNTFNRDSTSGNLTVLNMSSYGSSGNAYPVLNLQSGRGTQASPTQTQSGDVLGALFWRGYNSTPTLTGAVARISVTSTQAFTGGAQGAGFNFDVTRVNDNALTTAMTVSANATGPAVTIGGTGGNGGNVVHGCTRRSNTATASVAAQLDCVAGEILMGGGCYSQTGGVAITRSYPADNDTWECLFASSGNHIAYGVCCRY